MSERARMLRLLNRAGYGPRPGDLDRALELGYDATLEAQLHAEEIADPRAERALAALPTVGLTLGELLGEDRKTVIRELQQATVTRGLTSRRQLYEAMVEFWSDHFNIYLYKNQHMAVLKAVDDREVIRAHALGTFRDLLSASVHSPAMLCYLDNQRNRRTAPNENYARELLELHTLGIDGGYTHADIDELARCLTGWTISGKKMPPYGRRRFAPRLHDPGSKEILGHRLAAGQGEDDVRQVIDLLARHPSTAAFVSRKLVRRFVADSPPASLVDSTARLFRRTGGDVKSLLRHIFTSDELAAAPPKLKRPRSFLLSALRAVDARLDVDNNLIHWLRQLGQPLFMWPAPDGYPDVASAWSNKLLSRWNFALALVQGRVRGVTVPWPAATLEKLEVELLAATLPAATRSLLGDYFRTAGLNPKAAERRRREGLALFLAGPAFQQA